MIVGNGIVHADETELDTISVTAAYINPGSFEANLGAVTFTSYIGYGNPMTSSGKSMVERAYGCAINYGDLNWNVPKNPVTFTMQYGFGYGFDGTGGVVGYVTSYNAPMPSSGPPFPYLTWIRFGGVTNSTGSTIFRDALDNGIDRLINATAHEIAHQNGANELEARAKGNDAQNAYLLSPTGC